MRTKRFEWDVAGLGLLAASALLACSGSREGARLLVGHEPTDAAADAAPSLDGGPGSSSGESRLSLTVQDDKSMTVEVITLACRGDCADLRAVAKGGQPPYTYEWEDGTRGPARHVCLDRSTTLRVQASDSGLDAGEFRRPPQTAEAEVSAQVTGCGDPALCITNPSFEGAPYMNPHPLCPSLPVSPVPDFQVCECSPDVGPIPISWQAAADGSTYLAFFSRESWGTELCAELSAGAEVPFSVEVSAGAEDAAYVDGYVQIWAGATPCGMDELLWQSAPIAPGEDWRRECGVLRPSATYSHLLFRGYSPDTPGGDGTSAYVNVDHFVAGDRCTP